MVKRHDAADGRPANTVVLAAIRDEIRRLDPRLTVHVDTLDQRVGKLQAKPAFQTLLPGGFALAGLLLAAIGLYGVIAPLVAQRTAEIGFRMALGATPGDVRRMILSQAAVWLGAGLLLGLTVAIAARKLIESLLFGTATDAPPALSATALIAAWLPARRAARVKPVRALRYE